MTRSPWLLRISGRRLVPLLMFAFALLVIGLRYQYQMDRIVIEVPAQESERLRERLNIDQARLAENLSLQNRLFVQRLVSALALHEGLERAYLVDAQQQVVASLARLDLGRPLAAVLGTVPAALAGPLLAPAAPLAIDVSTAADASGMLAVVPLQDGYRLLVWQDLARPLALRRLAVQEELVREAVAVLVAVAALALLLHLLWFRRARRLAEVLGAIGGGDFAARSHLQGRDELAHIGAVADRMAEQLQQDQQRLRHMNELINRTSAVVIEWANQPGWPVLQVSEAVRQWGYEPDQLLRGELHYNALFHPDDEPRVNAEVAQYFEHGPDQYRQEYRIRRADGDWAWVDDRTSLMRNPAGEVISISGVLLDVTAQKQAEQAQREQAEQLRMFYELPFLGMAISSPVNKRWLQVNDRLCEILGYGRAELLAMSWADMTPPGDLERNVELFDELVAGRRDGYRLAKRFVRQDGGIVHADIAVRALRHADGSIRQLFATIQDVTERKRYEQQLQQMQDQLLKAQRIGNMGSWTMDLRNRRFTASPQALVIYGTDPRRTEFSLEEAAALVVPEDRPLVQAVVRRGASTGEPCDLRCRVMNPAGVRHLHVRAEFESEDGQFVRCTGMVVDETDLVQAQRERDRLASVMETTADIVSMADPQGRVFYFNRAGYEMLGLQPGQPLDDVIQTVHPAWAAQLVHDEGIPAAMAGGRWIGDSAVLDAQGREVPMSQLIMAHRGVDGQVEYLWTILRDISERKAAEAALELERSQLAEAQAVAHIGSWTILKAERRLIWSAENYRVLGLDPQQVQPSVEAFLAVVHPDDLAMVRAQLEHDMQRSTTGSNRFEHRIVTAQGVRYVEQRANIEVDPHGSVVRVTGTTMDITERVLADQALRQAKGMLEQAESVAQLGSFAYDSETGALSWSRQAFATIGLPWAPTPPSIDDYCACIHADDVAAVRSSIDCLLAGQNVPEVRFRTAPDRGPVRWLRRVYQRIDRSDQGLMPRYIGTLQDITDAVLAEEQLRQINQELEQRVAERTAQLSQANQELEAFSYSVSHDLKAPLRGIDGYSQLLVEEYGPLLDEQGRDFVGRIRHGVQLMGTLISDLLEYSRMERRGMNRDVVALQPLVQQVLAVYEADIQRAGVQVQMELQPFTLSLDREGIAVVLRNLIGNALKFSRNSQPPRLAIGSHQQGGRRILWVRDNGVGFDMKYHDRMFGIFQRLHRAEEFPGTGVGLALVAKAVQRMGGRVWAESAPGAGATFYLEFPE